MPDPKRKHILLIAKWYPHKHDPQLGVFIQKHARAISEYADVSVFFAMADASNSTGKLELDIQDQNNLSEYRVYYPKNTSVFSSLVNAYRYRCASKLVLRTIKKKHGLPDLTHAYIMIRPAMIAWLMKKFYRIPYMISEQWSGYANGEYLKKSWTHRMFSKFLFKHASGVTVVSEFLKKKMRECGINITMTVIPNIIELNRTNDSLNTLSKSGCRILMVADLVDEIKNVSGVIRAMKTISAESADCKLHIIGNGKDFSKLKNLAAELKLLNETVFLEGLKSNEEVYEFLQKSDFLVMNSRFETFSLICAEAMSCGKPVIATRCGGPEEFVTPETGILIQPDNQEELLNSIRTMIQTHHEYNSNKIKGYVLDKFSPHIAGRKFLEIYEQILAS